MNSVFRTVFWGAWPVGSVIGGYLGSVFGPVPAILIGGAGFAVSAPRFCSHRCAPLGPRGTINLFITDWLEGPDVEAEPPPP